MWSKIIIVVFVVVFVSTTTSVAQTVQKVSIKQVDSIITNSTTPLVINFWATFCIPCIEEMPYFKTAYKKYESNGVRFLLVSVDIDSEYPDGIKAFLKKKKINTSSVWLDETDPNYYMPIIHKDWQATVPVTLFVNNAKGIKNFVVNKLSKKELDKQVIALLN